MVKAKSSNQKAELEDDFNFDLDDEDLEDNKDNEFSEENLNKFSYSGKDNIGGGESVDDKPTLEKIFGPSKIIRDIEMTLRGFTIKEGEWVPTNNPIGTDDFINTTINGLRSIINETNMVSSMEETDIEFILKEKNKEFIFLLLDPTCMVEDHKVEAVGNMYDHALQLFMGFLAGGHGSKVLRQIHASLYQELENVKKDGGWGVKWNDRNLVQFGGTAK